MLSSPSPSSSGQLSQLGASLYGPQSKCLFFSYSQSRSSFLTCSIFGVKINYLWGIVANKTRLCKRVFSGLPDSICVSSMSFCRRARLLGKGHGEQYASVKPKFNARHAATKSYHPHNRSPHHVPPYPSITKQVCLKMFTCL